MIIRATPAGRERAKNPLWAAAKLAGWALPLGLEAVPEVPGVQADLGRPGGR